MKKFCFYLVPSYFILICNENDINDRIGIESQIIYFLFYNTPGVIIIIDYLQPNVLYEVSYIQGNVYII